jgi:hypothetical protein
MNDTAYLGRLMQIGKDKARTSAAQTISMVRHAMGVNYY